MDKMVHLSLRAMQGVMNRQTAIANNMANADTTGFRAEIVSAQAQYVHGEGLQSRATPNEYVLTADLNPGAIKSTGRPLDIALGGQSMLAVQAPGGDDPSYQKHRRLSSRDVIKNAAGEAKEKDEILLSTKTRTDSLNPLNGHF